MSLIDLDAMREKNRMGAFIKYVRDWKKQNPKMIRRDGNIFSYQTKRGKTKTFEVSTKKDHSLKVQGFYFREITEEI